MTYNYHKQNSIIKQFKNMIQHKMFFYIDFMQFISDDEISDMKFENKYIYSTQWYLHFLLFFYL